MSKYLYVLIAPAVILVCGILREIPCVRRFLTMSYMNQPPAKKGGAAPKDAPATEDAAPAETAGEENAPGKEN